ncbi:PLC-like phosphodiesterase [Delphinella strobiligena]|nr:PLC-like phosphodiesterase [Delphinella strobiligena]
MTTPASISSEMLDYAKTLFAEVSEDKNGIEGFYNFQGMTMAEYKDICPSLPVDDFDLFLQYLMSPKSSAVAPISIDPSYPISDYFVSTSHNTYLWGNQLYGHASTDAYRNVLERGCRSVEIDVWDPDSDLDSSDSDEEDEDTGTFGMGKLKRKLKKEVGLLKSHVETSSDLSPPKKDETTSPQAKLRPLKCEPRVLHGHTATRDVPFRTVCETIRQHAFQTSEYPLILSLEVHTSPPQQLIMVEIMKEVFGSYLGDLDVEVNDDTPLPILEDLRQRILIKVKYSARKRASKVKSTSKSSGAEIEGESSEEEQAEALQKGKIIPELGSMGTYTRSYHFKSLEQPEAKLPLHVFSLSESKLIDTYKQDASALFRHNKKYLMRAYPKSMRINSTNLDPAPFWRQGVQMVALNWQYINAATMLNQAMFEATGGWVLKPEGYRSQHPSYHREEAMNRGTLDLAIEIFAGQNIGPSGKRLRLYVRCELHIEDSEEDENSGLLEAGQSKEGQIKARTENASGDNNPNFKRQVLRFRKVPDVAEELTFIRFKIMDDETLGRDDMVAWACLRISRLQQGIRMLHFHDEQGQPTEGRLLVRINKSIGSA